MTDRAGVFDVVAGETLGCAATGAGADVTRTDGARVIAVTVGAETWFARARPT